VSFTVRKETGIGYFMMFQINFYYRMPTFMIMNATDDCCCVWSVVTEVAWTVYEIVITTVLVCVATVVAIVGIIIVVWLRLAKHRKNIDHEKNKDSALLVSPQSNETLRDMIECTGSGSGRPSQLFL